MSNPPDHEEKSVAQDSKKLSDSKAADNGRAVKDSKAAKDSIPLSKAALVLLKLKLIAMHGAPVLAVMALIIAAISITGNLSSQAQLGLATAKLESMNASLSASNAELEKLKASIALGKAMQGEERIRQDELVSEIIRNVTNLQIKLKIYPTLEEQLVQHTSAAPK